MPKEYSKYRLSCPICNEKWNGDSLNNISKNVANHWNEEHHGQLRHSYEKIDEIVIGGHHVHENEHIVEKIPIYITCFDVIDRLGQEDGFAVLNENMSHCKECMKFLSHDDKDENKYCKKCKKSLHIEKIQNNNHQLDSF